MNNEQDPIFSTTFIVAILLFIFSLILNTIGFIDLGLLFIGDSLLTIILKYVTVSLILVLIGFSVQKKK